MAEKILRIKRTFIGSAGEITKNNCEHILQFYKINLSDFKQIAIQSN